MMGLVNEQPDKNEIVTIPEYWYIMVFEKLSQLLTMSPKNMTLCA